MKRVPQIKKVAVVTGTRAEYGLLKPLIKAIQNDLEFTLQLIVTGMHLDPNFGLTYRQIELDGFVIDAKVDCKLTNDTAEAITKSIGTGMIGFADVYKRLNPDLIVLLGDRSEIFAAATAGMIKAIPIAHIHGGETTEGAYDESIRHAITKMSYLHFTSSDIYRKRVIQLGESPDRVFNVGAIVIDSIKNLKLLSLTDFEESIDFKLNKINVLITYHPVTLDNASAEVQFRALLKSLDKLKESTLIFTKPNSDKDGGIIIELIDNYVCQNREKAVSFISLGQLRYLSALQYVNVVVGNSSSGIYEAPFFKKPTINIGDRQKGRLMPQSVINCEPSTSEIDKALKLALDSEFNKNIQNQNDIFGDGKTTYKIMKEIKSFKIGSIKKSFHDL